MLTSDVYVLSLFAELLKNIKRIDQGFPHIGVCPWLVPHLVSSCLGLSSAIYVYVLFAVYFNVDVHLEWMGANLKLAQKDLQPMNLISKHVGCLNNETAP